MRQTFQLNTWYHHVDQARIHQLAEEVLRSAGFDFEPLPPEFHSWNLVRLGDRSAWCAVSSQSEDHCVFELKTSIDSMEALRATFLTAFDRLLTHPDLVPAECALTAANPDVYPFFTHSFFRGSTPITIVEVPDQEGGEPIEHTSADADYWEQAGRALHFVATTTMERFNVNPAAWAEQIHAKAITVPDGVVFDCGWSEAWPLPAIAEHNR